ncbi:MAG: BatA domain-containing protein [Pirellulales bacterium]|nr:BatA domain-containing protein [Pirellulales bacterium]
MLSFLPGYAWFALGGLIAATAPVIIHLLNRRRFKVVNWAAMDFLREALQRNRKILHLRDILLLILRSAALALFGLALARPFFQQSATSLAPNQPLHVALVIDNSLSMGYQQSLGKSVLEEAKARAKEFIETLPEKSVVAVIPLCGSATGATRDSYRNAADAVEAIDRIEVVDRAGRLSQAVDLAQATFSGSEFPPSARLIALVSDNQARNWPSAGLAGEWLGSGGESAASVANSNGAQLSGSTASGNVANGTDALGQQPRMVVLDVAPRQASNTWVADVQVLDGIADVQTPTTILARIRHDGPEPRGDVQVSLTIDGEVRDSKKVDLNPGQELEVAFRYRFEAADRLPGQIDYVRASVALTPDALAADDQRYVIIPVVSELPVLFIDQYGSRNEDPRAQRFGETYPLRRLLAPKLSANDMSPQLIKVVHLSPDELTQELLQTARLVVLAGIASPGDTVPLLREYVRQGGPLVIVAGGNFDPVQWQETAWLEGAGILPAPLKPQFVGKPAEEISSARDLFTINPDSLAHAYFQFPDMSKADQRRFFTSPGMSGVSPVMFRLAEAALDTETLAQLQKSELQRVTSEQEELQKILENEAKLSAKEKQGPLSATEVTEREAGRRRRAILEPRWLTWLQRPALTPAQLVAPEKIVAAEAPRALATLSNGLPLIVERNIGAGTVTFVSTGLSSRWSMLALSDVFVVFDRMLRDKIDGTLPRQNLSQIERIRVPVQDNLMRYSVLRPGSSADDAARAEPLSIEAFGPDEYGVIVRNVTNRGIYTVRAQRGAGGGMPPDSAVDAPATSIPFAVNGPSDESALGYLGRAGFDNWIEQANNPAAQDTSAASAGSPATAQPPVAIQWLERGTPVSLSGALVWGQSLWWWLTLTVLLFLLGEMLLLAWPLLTRKT